jgi:hypothetical protein
MRIEILGGRIIDPVNAVDKQGGLYSLPEGMFKEVMNDLWLTRISSLSNEIGLYVVLLEVLLFMPNSLFPLFMTNMLSFLRTRLPPISCLYVNRITSNA